MAKPNEIEPSVVYRGKPGEQITLQDYIEASSAIRDAAMQLEPDGNCCRVCGDSGHQAWECHHNPLVMARRGAQKEQEWRCFHCGAVFTNPADASEHFGHRRTDRPAWCVGMVEAIFKEFEDYGLHRNQHNAASVHQLIDLVIGKVMEIVRPGPSGPHYLPSEIAEELYGLRHKMHITEQEGDNVQTCE